MTPLVVSAEKIWSCRFIVFEVAKEFVDHFLLLRLESGLVEVLEGHAPHGLRV